MKNNPGGRLTLTILSISLLTVMAGAAIAPALGVIRDHFSDAPDLLVQMIVSLPALLIIITNLLFPWLCSLMKTRTLALTGLLLYVLTGAGCFFVKDIWLLLAMRALLGVSVGMIMPLSTGLLAGLLANISWNYAFLVYLLGLIAVVLVVLFLPNERLKGGKGPSLSLLKRFHPSVVGMILVMILFFIYPTRFALSAHCGTTLSNNAITLIMVGLDVVAFLIGLAFGSMMNSFRHGMKYVAPAGFIAGFLLLSMGSGLPLLLGGSALIGFANGVGVPYLNTIASMKAGKEAASTVMPLLSAALYLGQFLSPLIVTPLGSLCFGSTDILGPFKAGVLIGIIYLAQAFLTRKKQVVE